MPTTKKQNDHQDQHKKMPVGSHEQELCFWAPGFAHVFAALHNTYDKPVEQIPWVVDVPDTDWKKLIRDGASSPSYA
jgi:hypothetical protein